MKLIISIIVQVICISVLICVAQCGSYTSGNIVSDAGSNGLFESSSNENTTEVGKNINIFNGIKKKIKIFLINFSVLIYLFFRNNFLWFI